eukprot:sb/3465473/
MELDADDAILRKIITLLWEKTQNLERIQETYEGEVRILKARVALLEQDNGVIGRDLVALQQKTGLAVRSGSDGSTVGMQDQGHHSIIDKFDEMIRNHADHVPDQNHVPDQCQDHVPVKCQDLQCTSVEIDDVFSVDETPSSSPPSIEVGVIRPVLHSGLSYGTSTFHGLPGSFSCSDDPPGSCSDDDATTPVPMTTPSPLRTVVTMTESPGTRMRPVLLIRSEGSEDRDSGVATEDGVELTCFESQEIVEEEERSNETLSEGETPIEGVMTQPPCMICDPGDVTLTRTKEEAPSLLEVDTPPASPPDTTMLLTTKWNAPWSRSDTFDVLPTGSTHPATVPAKPLRRVTPGSGTTDPPGGRSCADSPRSEMGCDFMDRFCSEDLNSDLPPVFGR